MRQASGYLARCVQPVQFGRHTQEESAKSIIDEPSRVFTPRVIHHIERTFVAFQPERIIARSIEFPEQLIQRLIENFHASAVANIAARRDESEQEWVPVHHQEALRGV